MLFRSTGRPPYVWLANAFANTGLEQVSLVCQGAGVVPVFTSDVGNQPTQCASGAGPATAVPTINYFDKDFKFQQALKITFGVDHRLPWGMVGTIDFLHSRGLNDMYLTDINVGSTDYNAEGRLLYGAPANTADTRSNAVNDTSVLMVGGHMGRSPVACASTAALTTNH